MWPDAVLLAGSVPGASPLRPQEHVCSLRRPFGAGRTEGAPAVPPSCPGHKPSAVLPRGTAFSATFLSARGHPSPELWGSLCHLLSQSLPGGPSSTRVPSPLISGVTPPYSSAAWGRLSPSLWLVDRTPRAWQLGSEVLRAAGGRGGSGHRVSPARQVEGLQCHVSRVGISPHALARTLDKRSRLRCPSAYVGQRAHRASMVLRRRNIGVKVP